MAVGQYQIFNHATGTTTTQVGSAYTGPVTGLTETLQYAGTQPNLDITSFVANSYILTGSGDDTIDVSNAGGSNILDGGGGSNLLIGGTPGQGSDQFYLDPRGATATTWSTLANFHAGDGATVWGVTQQNTTITWLNGQGASGYTGLTGVLSTPGQPLTAVTLAGYTTADLTNGRLSVSYGATAAQGSAAGASYLHISANPVAAAAIGSATYPLVIMPLGDSFTASGGTAVNGGPPPGGYRAPLYAGLTAAGYSVQYVGDQTSNPGGGLPVSEDHHEGIAGYSIQTVGGSTTNPGLLNYIQANNSLQTYQPNVVLLDVGYNNLYVAPPEDVGATQAFAYLEQMVLYVLRTLPNAKLIVGTVPAVSGDAGAPTADPNSESQIGAYNQLILTKLQTDIVNANLSVVDINAADRSYTGAGGPAALIGPDGIHPTVTGFQVMANTFQAKIQSLFPAATPATASVAGNSDALQTPSPQFLPPVTTAAQPLAGAGDLAAAAPTLSEMAPAVTSSGAGLTDPAAVPASASMMSFDSQPVAGIATTHQAVPSGTV